MDPVTVLIIISAVTGAAATVIAAVRNDGEK
jgi:hypothetical protein